MKRVINEIVMRTCPTFYAENYPDGILQVGEEFEPLASADDFKDAGNLQVIWYKHPSGGWVPDNHHSIDGLFYLEDVIAEPVITHTFAFFDNGSYAEPASPAPAGLETTHTLELYSDGHYVEATAPAPAGDVVYRVMNDLEVSDTEITINGITYKRPAYRIGVPCVYTLEPTHRVYLKDREQRLSFRLFQHGTPSMTLDRQKNRWRAYLAGNRAFSNKTGFDMEGDPRRDVINNQDNINYVEWPAHDKIRVCGEPQDNPQAFITGVEQAASGTLKTFAPDTSLLGRVKGVLHNMGILSEPPRTLLSEEVYNGGILIVDTIDINNLPDNLDDIVNLPHIRATTPGSGENDFPQGDGEPVMVPLFADHNQRPVTYPLIWLERISRG